MLVPPFPSVPYTTHAPLKPEQSPLLETVVVAAITVVDVTTVVDAGVLDVGDGGGGGGEGGVLVGAYWYTVVVYGALASVPYTTQAPTKLSQAPE